MPLIRAPKLACPHCPARCATFEARAAHIQRWHGIEAQLASPCFLAWVQAHTDTALTLLLAAAVIALGLLIGGCPGFAETQQAWLAYRYSPAYYETTTYHELHTPHGGTYCTQTCGLYDCKTTCNHYAY